MTPSARRVVADKETHSKELSLACLHELASDRPAVVVGEGQWGATKAVQVLAHMCNDARRLGMRRPLVFPTVVAEGHGMNRENDGVGAAEGFRTSPRAGAGSPSGRGGEGGGHGRARARRRALSPKGRMVAEGAGEDSDTVVVLTKEGNSFVRPSLSTKRAGRDSDGFERPIQMTFAVMPGSVMG